jgi:hypothetical protein
MDLYGSKPGEVSFAKLCGGNQQEEGMETLTSQAKHSPVPTPGTGAWLSWPSP